MTQLSCCADTCEHHKDGYCSLNCIEVGGRQADMSSGTCCSSFVEKSESFTNRSVIASPYSDIKCEAENCQYNYDCHCEADYVDVAGHCACESKETLCSTFKCR